MIKQLIIFLFITVLYNSNIYAIIINKEEPVYYFVNHEEQIADLREKLQQHKIVGVTGITGMGKSEIVRKYAQEYAQGYDIIAFIDTSVDLTPQFMLIAKAINQRICPDEQCYISENIKNVKNSLMEYLKPKNNWLLIFDNLHLNENYKIKDIIDWYHNGHIIICSQDSKYLLPKIVVPYLQEKHVITVINKIIKNQPLEFIRELARSVQGYPTYMISHSAIFLQNNNHMTIKEYIDYMEKHHNKLRAHLNIVLKEITPQSKDLLYKMVLLNTQRIPRYLLEQLMVSSNNLSELFDEIIRFGVVEQINEDRNNQIFRIHDAVKEELLHLAGSKLNQQNVNLLLDGFNNMIPEAVNKRLVVLKNSSFLEGNLEILLHNADKYKADLYKIMELREKLLWYYLIGQRHSYNAKKMIDWFQNTQHSISLWFRSDKEKSVYSGYLVFIGMYKYAMDNQPIKTTMQYLDKAEKIVQKTSGYQELKSYIYANKAIIQLAIGNVSNAEENIGKAEKIRPTSLKTFLGMNLVETVKADILLAKGQYQEALNMLLLDIDKLYSPVDKATKGVFLASEYIIQAMILNYMGKFKEAYDIVNNNIYENIKNRKKEDISTTVLAGTLTELSRAELGVGKEKEALDHAHEAVNLLVSDESRHNKEDDLDNSKDIFLAHALVAKADALSSVGKAEEATSTYRLVKNIYWNIYGIKNIGNMDNVSYTFARAAKAAKNLPNDKESHIQCAYFYTLLLKYFGPNHPKTEEIYGICH